MIRLLYSRSLIANSPPRRGGLRERNAHSQTGSVVKMNRDTESVRIWKKWTEKELMLFYQIVVANAESTPPSSTQPPPLRPPSFPRPAVLQGGIIKCDGDLEQGGGTRVEEGGGERVDSRPWPRIGGPHEYLFVGPYRFNFS